jgi:mevalonate kinase
MVKEKQIAVAKEYLAGKTLKGIWVNSEAELFSSEDLAMKSDEDSVFVKNTKEDETSKKELSEEDLKLLEDTELTKENYQVMASLIKAFEIKTTDKKAETFIEALTQFKESLKTV